MRNHKSAVAFDVIATVMAYLIFAVSLLAVNMIKYPVIRYGFYAILVASGAMIIYNIHCLNKGLKNSQ